MQKRPTGRRVGRYRGHGKSKNRSLTPTANGADGFGMTSVKAKAKAKAKAERPAWPSWTQCKKGGHYMVKSKSDGKF